MMKFVVGVLTLCFGAVLAFENNDVEDMDIMALRILSGHNLTNGTVSNADTKYSTEIVNSIATSKTVNTTQIQAACNSAAPAVKTDLATFLKVAAADITVGTCVAAVKAAAGAGRRLAGHAGKSFTATIPVEILVKKGTKFNKDQLSSQEYANNVGASLKKEMESQTYAGQFGTITVTSAKPKAPTVTDPNATTTSTSTTTTTTVDAGGEEEEDTTTTTTTTKKASKKKATTTTSTTTTSGATSNVVGISLVLSALMMLNRF